MVTEGVSAKKVQEYEVFRDMTEKAITLRIRRLLMKHSLDDIDGLKIDPYRVQKWNHAFVVLLGALGAEKWVDAKSGLMNTTSVEDHAAKDAKANSSKTKQLNASR